MKININIDKNILLEYGILVSEIHKVEPNKALEMLQSFYKKHETSDVNNYLKDLVNYWVAEILQKQGQLKEALALYLELFSRCEITSSQYITSLNQIASVLVLLQRKEEALILVEAYLNKEINHWQGYLRLLQWYVDNLDVNDIGKLEDFRLQINHIQEELGIKLESGSLKDDVIYLAKENKSSNHRLMELNVTCSKVAKDVGIQMLTDYINTEKIRLYRQQAINLRDFILND